MVFSSVTEVKISKAGSSKISIMYNYWNYLHKNWNVFFPYILYFYIYTSRKTPEVIWQRSYRHIEAFTKLSGPLTCRHLNNSQRIKRSFGLSHMKLWLREIWHKIGKIRLTSVNSSHRTTLFPPIKYNFKIPNQVSWH